jgi:hypothetical protein
MKYESQSGRMAKSPFAGLAGIIHLSEKGRPAIWASLFHQSFAFY